MRIRLPQSNDFYRNHYHHVIMLFMVLIVLLICAISFVAYQLFNRPLPEFKAVDPDHKEMTLTPLLEPNLLPNTIIRWASKAAITAYSFDWVNYNSQILMARSYFTPQGWQGYLVSINSVIKNVVQGQLFVNGIVSGTPVISNQGPLTGKGQAWRVQIPFLVTYQAASGPTKRNFIVSLMLVRISTRINPQGIGIDQFVMVPV